MRQVKRVGLGAALSAALVLAACGNAAAPNPASTQTSTSHKIKVIATFSVVSDFVQNVAGDKVELKTLVGLGNDVHEFEPSPSDAQGLMDANLIVENGLGLEIWLDKLYQASGSKATRLVASKDIPTRKLTGGDGKEEMDPHVWQDVTNAITMVQNIRDGLVQADPPNAQTYQANAAAYITQLKALDADIVAETAKLPADSRKLVTSHDALGYFAERYGFKIIGSLLGTVASASGDPSAKDFAQLVSDIKTAGVKAVFVESVTNPATMERLAQEAGVKIGPELYTDSLGAQGSAGATYLKAMQYNITSIVGALAGQ